MAYATVANAKSAGLPSELADNVAWATMSFEHFKARYEAGDASVTTTDYDPRTEKLPQHNWYALDQRDIIHGSEKMCDDVLNLVENRCPDDAEISRLQDALQAAKDIPRPDPFYVAFLGDQGTGKSTLINTLLDRPLVEASANPSACTRYTTEIVHKVGAADNTRESDVTIVFYDDDEIRNLSEDLIFCYRETYPRRQEGRFHCTVNRQTSLETSDGRASESSETRPETSNILTDDDNDNALSDKDAEDSAIEMDSNGGYQKLAILKSRAVSTAKDFFAIIFDTKGNNARKEYLQRLLDFADDDRFVEVCIQEARIRLSEIGTTNRMRRFEHVTDHDLHHVREEWADHHWPLVKSIRISTGHVLLSNNLGLLDLPGYGDENYLRAAVIDRFRQQARFEIVVLQMTRSLTNTVQEKYLRRSTQRIGPDNTLLILNKSDEIIKQIVKNTRKVKVQPFPRLHRRLEEIKAIRRRDTQADPLIEKYRDYILRCMRAAYIGFEEDGVKNHMAEKDLRMEVLAVSAMQYGLCLPRSIDDDDDDDEEGEIESAALTPEATGIPHLRQHLLALPAQTNYDTLRKHVFDTLHDLTKTIQRILEKHRENDEYRKMREYMHTQLPETKEQIKQVAQRVLKYLIAEPWSTVKAEQQINTLLKKFVRTLCHPNVKYHGLVKMCKENGIPINGEYEGRNLNDEILQIFKPFLESWYVSMSPESQELAGLVNAPIQDTVQNLQQLVHNLPDDPSNAVLKIETHQAYETRFFRIHNLYNFFAHDLKTTMHYNYVHFSEEGTKSDPWAVEMKRIYHCVLDVPGDKGAHERHLQRLDDCLTAGFGGYRSLSVIMGKNIKNKLVESWQEHCDIYVARAMALLDEFNRIAGELLDTGELSPTEHRYVREQLKVLLPVFSRELELVQEQFFRLESPNHPIPNSQSDAAATEETAQDERLATQPPGFGSRPAKRLKFSDLGSL